MSIFDKVDDSNFAEDDDIVGGFSPLETDIYTGKIKLVYMGQSNKGAECATIVLDINGKEVRETIYLSSAPVPEKDGKPAQPAKYYYKKNDKEYPMPGLRTLMDICELSAGKTFKEVGKSLTDKLVKVYDFEQKKEIPKNVPVISDLLDKPIMVAINHIQEPKYNDPTKIISKNEISKVLDPITGKTLNEKTKNKEASFKDEWLAKWKNVIIERKGNATSNKKKGSPSVTKKSSIETEPLFPDEN